VWTRFVDERGALVASFVQDAIIRPMQSGTSTKL